MKELTTFPKSNRIEAAKSTEIILTLADITKIFPGHGNVESVTNYWSFAAIMPAKSTVPVPVPNF